MIQLRPATDAVARFYPQALISDVGDTLRV